MRSMAPAALPTANAEDEEGAAMPRGEEETPEAAETASCPTSRASQVALEASRVVLPSVACRFSSGRPLEPLPLELRGTLKQPNGPPWAISGGRFCNLASAELLQLAPLAAVRDATSLNNRGGGLPRTYGYTVTHASHHQWTLGSGHTPRAMLCALCKLRSDILTARSGGYSGRPASFPCWETLNSRHSLTNRTCEKPNRNDGCGLA